MASAVLLLGYQFNDGDISKYFGVTVAFAVALSLLSYLVIFPAFWMLRNKYPDTYRPYRVPAHRTVSIWLTAVVAFAILQILTPGFGNGWFSDAYRPAGWVADQGRQYFLTQLAVILVAVLIAVGFWLIGRRTLTSATTPLDESLDEDTSEAVADEEGADSATEDSATENGKEPESSN
jgi:amino acid transporter